MPIYTYYCSTCEKTEHLYRSIENRGDTPRCCGEATNRIIQAASILTDYSGYTCPVSGKWIEGKKAHQENLKRNVCRLLEPGEKQDMIRRKQQDNDDFDKGIEDTAARVIESFSQEKKELLASAMDHGLDVVLERR